VTECARFERSIADAGGIDVQILGLGTDGHIAFNEPGSSLASRTCIKTLTETTRMDNARFFSTLDEVPRGLHRHACLSLVDRSPYCERASAQVSESAVDPDVAVVGASRGKRLAPHPAAW